MASYDYTNGVTTLTCDAEGWARAIIPLDPAPSNTVRMRFAYRAKYQDLTHPYPYGYASNLSFLYKYGSCFGLSFDAKSPELAYPAVQNGSFAEFLPSQFDRIVGWFTNWDCDAPSQYQGWDPNYYTVGYRSKDLDDIRWNACGGRYYQPSGGDGKNHPSYFGDGRTDIVGTVGQAPAYVSGYDLGYVGGYQASWTTGSGPDFVVPQTLLAFPNASNSQEVTQGWEISGNLIDNTILLSYYVNINNLSNLLDVFDQPTYTVCDGTLVTNAEAGNTFTTDHINYTWPSYITMRMGQPGKMILEKHAVQYYDYVES